MVLENPTVLASGIMGTTVSSLNRIARVAGGVVTKSVTSEPREGFKNPTVVNVNCGILNAVGLSNPSAKLFAQELERYNGEAPLIVSLAGSEEEIPELVSFFPMAQGFELNLSCPHVGSMGAELGSDPELVENICRRVKKRTSKPIFVKLSPNVTDIVEIGRGAERGGADGVVAINTLRAMVIDVEAGKPILSNRIGGLSGKAIKPVAVRCVYELFETLKIPVIGCGGIITWRDAVEFLMAGASAVQIGSGVFYGTSIFKSVIEGIKDFLVRKNLSLEDVIGMAHRN